MIVNDSRRRFLSRSAQLGLTLSISSFLPVRQSTLAGIIEDAAPRFDSWQDIYRQRWTWDKVVRGTHVVNCWYQNNCAWDVYVKDGLVLREEQVAEYPHINANLPDFNPRGCQKGCCFSDRLYEPTRIRHPLRRVGPRGNGRWERVSWEAALDDIADRFIDTVVEAGPDRVIWDVGPSADFGTSVAAMFRFSALTHSVTLDMNTEIGDTHRGALECFGTIVGERSLDDYFYSDLILIWGANPVYTQIPNAHFFTEARYKGCKIVSISPDFNASAVHADLWIPVKPGTDAALALAVANLLLRDGAIDAEFIKEQTDLPLLVRMDTERFLCARDLGLQGDPRCPIMVDEPTGELRGAPWESLALTGIAPALDIDRKVHLADGSVVRVRSVCSLLRERLDEYTPEFAGRVCGTSAGMIERLAREIGASKAMANVSTSSLSKYYHGNLMERAIILLFALTGNLGRKGAGYSAFPMLTLDGLDRFGIIEHPDQWPELAKEFADNARKRVANGETMEMIAYDISHAALHSKTASPPVTSATLFWAVHGGLIDLADPKWDPFLRKPVRDYLEEALASKALNVRPAKGNTPQIIFSLSSNALRRVRGSHKVLETLWPKLKLHVVLDFRLNTTCQHADYVLPCAAHYERSTVRVVTPLSPFCHITFPATAPVGEAKPDWEIIALLAKHIQQRAQARGVEAIVDGVGNRVELRELYDKFTMNGSYSETDEPRVLEKIVELSGNVPEGAWEKLSEDGFVRYSGVGENIFSIGNMCEIPPDDAITHWTYHVRDKVPWATASRRIQFYIDHPLYRELDEALPRHKDAPLIGGDYPLVMTGGHCRESIHSTWRDNQTMLRLTRGEPFILMSPLDAKPRGISDHDLVRVFNDVGDYVVRAKITPAMQPGQSLIYHAWEDYQFKKGSMRRVTPTPLNPVEFAGDYPHLKECYLWGQPGNFDRETRVEIERSAQ